MEVSAFDLAERFIGTKEIPGSDSNPAVLAMLRLDADWPDGDQVPWCSAFVNYIAWLLRLPRSKSLRARSWLNVGIPVDNPEIGFDLVILQRGAGTQPGPHVIDAPGHVGFFAGFVRSGEKVAILGGNQGDAVTVAEFTRDRVLGFRRLA